MEEKSDFSKRYYVYILFSLKDKKLYIGFTTDLKARLTNHAQGRVRATMFRRPLKLIYYEYFVNQKDAKARERYLKSGFGRSQFKLALKDTLQEFGYQFR